MRRKFFSLILLSLILALSEITGIDNLLRKPTEPIIVNVKKTIFQNGYQLKYLPTILLTYNSLVNNLNEAQRYTNENRQLKLTITNLREENESLRRQLGAPLPPSFRFIPAEVIALSRYMELNVGASSGVKQGMVVIDGVNLIGRITEVSDDRSQVMLLKDSDLEIPAITERGSRGVVSGQLGDSIIFKGVLQKDPLFLDDLVLTTGEGNVPAKLTIGQISQIDASDVAVYKQARIKSFAVFDLLKRVFVVEEI